MTTVTRAIPVAARSSRTAERLVLRDRRAQFAALTLIVLAMLALGAPLLFGDPVAQNASGRLLPPSLHHPFGTDELRRDILTRTFFGLRTSLAATMVAVPVGASAGITLGFVAGYGGPKVDAVIMRFVDAWLAFPGLLASIAILTVLGPGMVNVGFALMLFTVPGFTRLARAQMLTERSRDYVVAAKALGAGPLRIVARHIAINALPPLITQLALALTASVLIAAALSFLGLGERAPAPSLGGLINGARPHLREAWWYLAFPSAVLGLLLLSLTLLADVASDALAGNNRR